MPTTLSAVTSHAGRLTSAKRPFGVVILFVRSVFSVVSAEPGGRAALGGGTFDAVLSGWVCCGCWLGRLLRLGMNVEYGMAYQSPVLPRISTQAWTSWPRTLP